MCVCVALQFVVTSCSLHFRFDLLSRLRFSATSASFKLRSSSLRWKMESQYQSVCFAPPPLQFRIARKRHLNFAPTSLLHSHVNLVPTLGLFFDATMDPFKWRLCRSLHMFPNQRMKRPLNPAAKRGPSVGWEIENAKPYAEPTVQFGCAGNVRIS